MTPSLELAIGLLLFGLFILALELFIPSVGLLFVIASLCVVGSVVVAFMVGRLQGMFFLIGVLILAVLLPGVGFQIWKRSWIGRRMFLDAPTSDEADNGEASELRDGIAPVGAYTSGMRGLVGKTLTPLRPAGIADFDGRRIDVVSEGVMIDRDEYVRVIAAQGNRVVVRQLAPEEIPAPPPSLDSSDWLPPTA